MSVFQLAKHEYQVAIELAEDSDGSYDLDLVYKRQWLDLKVRAGTEKRRLDLTLEDLKILVSRFLHRTAPRAT